MKTLSSFSRGQTGDDPDSCELFSGASPGERGASPGPCPHRACSRGQCRSSDKQEGGPEGEHPSLRWLAGRTEQEVAQGKGWGGGQGRGNRSRQQTVPKEGGCKARLRRVWGRDCIHALIPLPTSASRQCPPSMTRGSAAWLTVASETAANMSSCGSQTHTPLGFLTGSKRVRLQLLLG